MVIQKAEEKRLFHEATIGKGELPLSHLFYVDDAVFIGEWSQSNARNTIHILRCFYLIFGLKINIQKSKLIGIGVDCLELENMAGWWVVGFRKYRLITSVCRLEVIWQKLILGNG